MPGMDREKGDAVISLASQGLTVHAVLLLTVSRVLEVVTKLNKVKELKR